MSAVTTFYFKKPGLQTLIQDGGRAGYLSFGIPLSGAMDKDSAIQANLLVGNPPHSPVLEITLLGPVIHIDGSCQIALTGADLSPKINQKEIPLYSTINVAPGTTLSFGAPKKGCRSYLAIRGKWLIDQWLGSYSALTYNGLSATPQSIVQKGSELRVATLPATRRKSTPPARQPKLEETLVANVLPGPEFEQFPREAIGHFFSQTYRISNDSNRMGYRLEGKRIDFHPQKEVISSGVVPGTVQITRAGQPVILMADAQTVGGYYRIVNVISRDLDRLGQLKPGAEIRFNLIRSFKKKLVS